MKTSKRVYRSKVRAQRAAQTRDRILDAVARTLARGIEALTVPAVACEAGVSVATVYRYFGCRRDLLAALAGHIERKTGVTLEGGDEPRDPEALIALGRRFARRLEQQDVTLRAALASEVGKRIRRQEMIPARARLFETAMAASIRHLSPEDRIRMRNLFLVLGSSSALCVFKDYLGISADDAAEHVAWLIRQFARLGELAEREVGDDLGLDTSEP